MRKISIILFLIFLSLCACKEEKKETKEIIPTATKDKIQSSSSDILGGFFGEYEYKNTDNPNESLLLVLNKVDTKSISDFEGYSWEEKNEKGEVVEKTLTGLFYGNTDLFDEVREGYTPGFFVANIQVEPFGENSLKVNIKADSSDILENPVQPPIKSTKEALEKGNKKWEIKEINSNRELIFKIKNSKELILKSDLDLAEKTFKKIK
ncbi:hypothetical protein [Flavobacterium pectinovorum]|uniref:Lipoprotein n=1 Tax=Flavobacterium pectinovorum TaxID=29533 RepID=A0A502F504_9FLAO|nr:hypothetical protein [Flavobacterium pectinovorum]TPG45228.1 hypothetical protein EAH81_01090 [Flavobacterium pectinovorum]